jgi:hypothetical protein
MIKETLAFLQENSCLESSTLVLETLNLQNSSIMLLLTSHKHQAQAYTQIDKQKQLRTNTTNKNKLKKSAKRIGLIATVTRAQEIRKRSYG